MEKYKDMTIKKRSHVKMIRNLIFFFALIIFTFWYIFKDQDLNALVQAIKSANIIYIIIGTFIMLLTFTMESINIKSILAKLGEKKFSIFTGLKYTFIGNFFSAITPAATGGQPVEIYYMNKDGIKAANGTMAMLLQLCGFQISTIVYSIICAILNPHLLSDGIVWFYILGIAINGAALAFMLICVFADKLLKRIINWNMNMLKKIGLKNADRMQIKMEEAINQYSESSAFIKSHMWVFFKAIFRVFIQIGLYHSIPFFVYKAFGLSDLNFFQMFSMQAVLYTTVSGIPLPGAIGISETLFLKLYKMAFGEALLSGAMLLCRFVSFYFYLIVCAVVVVIVGIKTKSVDNEIDKGIKDIENHDIKLVSKNIAYV